MAAEGAAPKVMSMAAWSTATGSRLARMPEELLKRASEILNEYETNAKKKNVQEKVQLSMDFFQEKPKDDIIKKEIEKIDIMNMTPIAALNYLFELKEKIKKGE